MRFLAGLMLMSAILLVQPARAGSGGDASTEDAADVPLEIMIGQMLMVGFGGTDSSGEWAKALRDQVASGAVGGVFFLKRNVETKAQVKKLTDYFVSASPDLPPFMAVDQEGGRVQRMTAAAGVQDSPSAEEAAVPTHVAMEELEDPIQDAVFADAASQSASAFVLSSIAGHRSGTNAKQPLA